MGDSGSKRMLMMSRRIGSETLNVQSVGLQMRSHHPLLSSNRLIQFLEVAQLSETTR